MANSLSTAVVVVVTLSIFGPARAETSNHECPALFGSSQSRAANKHRREMLLYWTQQDNNGVVIAHGSQRWRRPERIDFAGLEVLAKGNKATITVNETLAKRAGCPAGDYPVGVDDSIGKAAILAVLREGLLLELAGELQYWGHGHCQWMMAWGSRYRMVMQVKRNKSVRAKPRPRRKKPRKRRRRR